MSEPSHDDLRNPVLPETKNWFGQQMQIIAILHDLAGPDISLVELERYRNEVAAELCRRALTAHATGKLVVELADLDALCQIAADELIGIRQMRQAHAHGKLQTKTMKQLPLYKAFQSYLDEDPELVRQVFAAALVKQDERDAVSSSPPPDVHATPKPSGTATSFSSKTELWLETQVLAFALAEDLSDRPCTQVDEDEYVCQSAPCFRKNIIRAIQLGNLTIATDEIDDLCLHAAAKALELRQLKVAFANGQISRQKLKKFPEYQRYREYLEQAPATKSLMQHAAILQEALRQQKSSKAN